MYSETSLIEGFLIGLYSSMVLSSALIMLFYSLVYKLKFSNTANPQVIVIYLLYAFACLTFGLFTLFVMQVVLPEVKAIFPDWVFIISKYSAPISLISFTWLLVTSAPLKSLSVFIYWQQLRNFFYLLCLVVLVFVMVLVSTNSVEICAIISLELFIPICILVTIIAKKDFYSKLLSNFMYGFYLIVTLCFLSLLYLAINSDVTNELNIYIRFFPFLIFGVLLLLQSYTIARFNHEEVHSLGNHSIVKMRRFFMQVYQGFKNDEFFMVYQPQVSVHNNQVVGAEALIRWKHSDTGFIPTDRFIDIAEHTDIIDTICYWIIDTVIQDMKVLLKNDLNMCISINFSVRNLKPCIIKYLKERLDKNSISTKRIIIEITESLDIDYNEKQQQALELINKLGIRVSLDDYGTGFSSVSRLEKLGIDEIKIDKIFLNNFESSHKNQAIVYSTIQMGHALDIIVVAEGVETLQEMRVLKKMGCDIAQGFVISRPMKMQMLPEWIDKNGIYSKSGR